MTFEIPSVWLYGLAVLVTVAAGHEGLRRLSLSLHRWREARSGMRLTGREYGIKTAFESLDTASNEFVRTLRGQPTSDDRSLVGFDEQVRSVYLSDRARSMHLHVIGQTGSGKTKGVLHPLLFQDIWRPHSDSAGRTSPRSVLFLDGKGALENEEALCRIAKATGREDDLRIFTLNPHEQTQTYNPLFIAPGTDPRAVAERFFSTFSAEMGEPYYRDMAREMFVNLVIALASSGKQMCVLDLVACLADESTLLYALKHATDTPSVWRIRTRLDKLGKSFDSTYSGLLSALTQYDHPAINAYDPDIVLERDLNAGKIIGFSLSANAYKVLSRSIGITVLQHLQQIGAERQMTSGPHVPVSVVADEFNGFAYEGFVDAVNKLRDAGLSLVLSHQSWSDLERVSDSFARAIWDNTRNKLILYCNDEMLCERIAGAVGTKMGTELTVRRGTDHFLNQVSLLEASSREVDEFILHPNQLKSLRVGQAYLVQAGTAEHLQSGETATRVQGLNLPLLPPLPAAPRPTPKTPDNENGLRLYEQFVLGAMA